LPGAITWAYEYCPTAYAWMAMVGLVLYLVFFAPGKDVQLSNIVPQVKICESHWPKHITCPCNIF
jgi:hypothetical protein